MLTCVDAETRLDAASIKHAHPRRSVLPNGSINVLINHSNKALYSGGD